jgi:PTS system mannose-specific IIA component
MVGVVIVGHGRLAEEMLRTLQAVVGRLERVDAVVSGPRESPRRLYEKIATAVRRVDAGDGVLLLTDMLGDTQTNQCLAVARAHRAEVVAGVNMPMLVKATTIRRELTVRELARAIARYGQDHIVWATERGTPAAAVRRPGGDEPGRAEIER